MKVRKSLRGRILPLLCERLVGGSQIAAFTRSYLFYAAQKVKALSCWGYCILKRIFTQRHNQRVTVTWFVERLNRRAFMNHAGVI